MEATGGAQLGVSSRLLFTLPVGGIAAYIGYILIKERKSSAFLNENGSHPIITSLERQLQDRGFQHNLALPGGC